MSRVLDVDPNSGIKTTFDYDPLSDRIEIKQEQDLSGFLDHLQRIRNERDTADKGIAESWWHYCSIPEIVQIELFRKGIDILNPAHAKRVFDEVNTNYPYLKLTNKTHKVASE